jgi:uncharacterized caspase-like protein
MQRGGYYALVIGIKNYQSLPKLETPLDDATAIAEVLRQRYGFEVNLLLDASRHQILSALADYRRKLQQNDNLLLYFAGHGQYDSAAGRRYWLPADAEPTDDANWIIADEITSNVRALAALHVLVVSDSCYSGTLTRSMGPANKPGDPTQYLQKMLAGIRLRVHRRLLRWQRHRVQTLRVPGWRPILKIPRAPETWYCNRMERKSLSRRSASPSIKG